MYEKAPPTLQEILLQRKTWLKFELAEVDRLLKLAYPKYDPRANGSSVTEPEPTPAPKAGKRQVSTSIIEHLSKVTEPVPMSAIVDAFAPGSQGKDRSATHSNLQTAVNNLIEKGLVKAIPTTIHGRSKYVYELIKTEPE